jgi:PIN domain nuclease of toxin-antitoxin system
MTALLDTHTFIWMDSEPAKLSATVLAYLANPACVVYLSVASIWEMEIKVSTKKLTLRAPVRDLIAENLANTPLQLLDIRAAHAHALVGFPRVRKDPFDRMLAAQSLIEGAVLLTDDPIFKQYPIHSDW